MLVETTACVTVMNLLEMARDLKSEHGENPEYDRALVELCTDAIGRSQEDYLEMYRLLGIKPTNELSAPTTRHRPPVAKSKRSRRRG